MLVRLAADAVLLLHLGFVLIAAQGALPALRWRWLVFVHLPATAYSVTVKLGGGLCPLTPLESALDERALAAGVGPSTLSRLLASLITREIQFVLCNLLLTPGFSVSGSAHHC